MEAELELVCFPDQHNSMVSREYGKGNCFLITRLAPYITVLKDDALRRIQGKELQEIIRFDILALRIHALVYSILGIRSVIYVQVNKEIYSGVVEM